MGHDSRRRRGDILLALLGVAGLLASRHLGGTFGRMHGANLSASFGAFFLLRLFPFFEQRPPWLTALAALLLVTAAEFAQYAGLYPGTYDAADLGYNTAGVLLAWGIGRVGAGTQARGGVPGRC